MYTSVTVREMLERKKGYGYWAVTPMTTAYDALELMAEKDIGAVLVMDGQRLVGMFSERDYARKVILRGRSSKETTINELMTSPAITAGPELSLQDCMVLMNGNRIRHLPVVEAGAVLGVLNIGDVLKTIISAQDAVIHHLEGYISGEEYGVSGGKA